jgi:hypothetical protein
MLHVTLAWKLLVSPVLTPRYGATDGGQGQVEAAGRCAVSGMRQAAWRQAHRRWCGRAYMKMTAGSLKLALCVMKSSICRWRDT